MFKRLNEQHLPVLIALMGFAFVVVGFFQKIDLEKYQIIQWEKPVYSIIGFGIVIIFASVIIYVYVNLKLRGSAEKFKKEAEKLKFAAESTEAYATGLLLPEVLKSKPDMLNKRVFLSAPMNALLRKDDLAAYGKSREFMMEVSRQLIDNCGIKGVFYAGEKMPRRGEWELPGVALKKDIAEIRECEYFILYWPEEDASRSSLIEAGIAMTLNKKCIYLVKD